MIRHRNGVACVCNGCAGAMFARGKLKKETMTNVLGITFKNKQRKARRMGMKNA